MLLYNRYLKGETEDVYEELHAMGETALSPEYLPETEKILTETFRRVWLNLNEIHKELLAINYHFTPNPDDQWQKPLTPPVANTNLLIEELQSKAHNRYIPLSLQYFYRQIGSCNFCWDYQTAPDILWEGADPIDIPPIAQLIDMIDDEYEQDEILICGDSLTKDNVSGSGYFLELTESPAVDSFFQGPDVNFISYLRETFHNCGFTLAEECDSPGLEDFIDRVRPRLLMI